MCGGEGGWLSVRRQVSPSALWGRGRFYRHGTRPYKALGYRSFDQTRGGHLHGTCFRLGLQALPLGLCLQAQSVKSMSHGEERPEERTASYKQVG